MKKLMVALLATSAMGLAAPALAHESQPPYVQDNDWNNDVDTYAEFNQEYQHIWQGIQHGVSDGSYTRRQAQQYYRALQQIRARADMMQRSGYYNPQDIQVRLERLHDYMHVAHERGHERQNRYSGYYNYRR